MIWREFKEAAPQMAQLGEGRFQRKGVALLGTVRKDSSARINPVEPYLVQGHLLLGVMWQSQKGLDLLRDPRCVLHSAVCDPNGSEGEFKLRARAVQVQDTDVRERYRHAFYEKWGSRPPEAFHIFSLEIESAAFIAWEVEKGEMIVKRWSPELGLRETRRKYP